mmetsp:Transcript_2203/g.5157  ORF Transcript_2203/g.5157 Transcript_2203/m.5157 type:complete len:467 (-) Transcript_2203:338-1738(-)
MAPMDAEKRARLQAILQTEDAKSALAQKVVKAQTDTAKSRSMVLSPNDKKMFVSGSKPEAAKIASSVPKRVAPKAAAKPKAQNASLHGMPSELVQSASYDTSTRTSYDGTLSKTRDWAVMSRFESEVFAREKAEIAAEKRQQVADQRSFLDLQMNEQAVKERHVAEEKQQLAEMVAADVARYKAEEAKKTRERRAKEAKIKVQQEEMLVESTREKAAAHGQKKAEEEADLAETKHQLEVEKQNKLNKAAKEKASYQLAMQFNEEQKMAKLSRKKALEEHEVRVADEYDAMLEAQENAREQATAEFHAKIAARGAKAGHGVAENMARKEAEEAVRMQKFYGEREAALAAKEAREQNARTTATQQQMEMLALQTRLRDDNKERTRAEMEAHYAEVRRREAVSKEEDKAKSDARRQAAVMNRMDLERQMEEKTMRKIAAHDDCMGRNERLLNLPILDQAKAVVLGDEDF